MLNDPAPRWFSSMQITNLYSALCVIINYIGLYSTPQDRAQCHMLQINDCRLKDIQLHFYLLDFVRKSILCAKITLSQENVCFKIKL